MNGWLVFLGLLAAYIGLVYVLRMRQARGPLPWNFELQGPFILWRTQWGKKAIRRVAKPARFWNVIADGGIILTWLLGIAIFALLLYQVTLYFTDPEIVAESAQPPAFLVGIPGINPLIPIGYGMVALVLALVIHEGSHGVMAYASRMRVKSLGLLFFIIPVGAFVEPDEEDLEKSTTREKNRVFAAGPTSNIVLAVAAGLVLSGFMGAMHVANDGEGVIIANVEAGSSAAIAGLRQGDLMTRFNGEAITDRLAYTEAVNKTVPGQRVTVEYLREGVAASTNAVLGDKQAYLEAFYAEPRTDAQRKEIADAANKGFLGVGGLDVRTLEVLRGTLQSPFSSLPAFLLYISYPFIMFFQKIDVLADPYTSLFTIEGPLAALPPGLFYASATLLYWIVWINIMLGTFNALPAGPLDGGQMFRATLRDRLMRRYRVDPAQVHVERADLGHLTLRGRDEATQAKLDRIQLLVRKTTWTLGLFILGLILLPIVGPPVLKYFL